MRFYCLWSKKILKMINETPNVEYFRRYESKIAAAKIKLMGRTTGYILLKYKKNLHIMKKLKARPIITFITNHRRKCFWNFSLKKPSLGALKLSKWKKIFGRP